MVESSAGKTTSPQTKGSTMKNVTSSVGVGIGALAVFAVIGFGVIGAGTINEQEQAHCTVEDKDRSTDKDGQSIYQVYTDCGVFRVTDNLAKGIFNAANIYSDIHVGETYDFTTVGFRVPVMSSFPTIVEVVEV